MKEAQTWSSGGASVNHTDSTIVKDMAITSLIGTEGPEGLTDPEDTADKVINYQAKDLASTHSSYYAYDIRYANTVWDSSDYWLYWSLANDGSCDCSTNLCTDMTHIDVEYYEWPNVGKPNCQEHGRPYRTYF